VKSGACPIFGKRQHRLSRKKKEVRNSKGRIPEVWRQSRLERIQKSLREDHRSRLISSTQKAGFSDSRNPGSMAEKEETHDQGGTCFILAVKTVLLDEWSREVSPVMSGLRSS